MSRIDITMSVRDMVAALSEGNPGALSVMSMILRDGDQIDPDNLLGGVGIVLEFDSIEVYGSRIWMLFKDVCGQDVTKTIAMMRAWQLGIIETDRLNHAIDNRGEGLDVDGTLAKVQERLPNFGKVGV